MDRISAGTAARGAGTPAIVVAVFKTSAINVAAEIEYVSGRMNPRYSLFPYGANASMSAILGSVEAAGTKAPPNLLRLRLGIGLEEPQLPIDDLNQALTAAE